MLTLLRQSAPRAEKNKCFNDFPAFAAGRQRTRQLIDTSHLLFCLLFPRPREWCVWQAGTFGNLGHRLTLDGAGIDIRAADLLNASCA